MKNIFYSQDLDEPQTEIVERKGFGHPDTIADHLAEHLSQQYSLLCKKRFGAVLHHNFDKLSLLGGSAHVEFGKGTLTSPIRIVINGRVTCSFARSQIPAEKLMKKWSRAFFEKRLPLLNVKKDLAFIFELSTQSSPGKIDSDGSSGGARAKWFSPRSLRDLPELQFLHSNDTSAGSGYAPHSTLEQSVIRLESYLNNSATKRHRWMGSDIKIMGFRHASKYAYTLCVPQIASYVNTLAAYQKNKNIILQEIHRLLSKINIANAEISINTRDKEEIPEIYLTATGTSLESGDEGVVGRGNRINGLITLQKSMSIEGASGKNPIYHIGKLYNICALRTANAIFSKLNLPCEVCIVSQGGRNLLDPWRISIRTRACINAKQRKQIETIIANEINRIPRITSWLIEKTRYLA